MEKVKQIKKLFKKLIWDVKSVFYKADRITKTLLNKGRKSLCKKDRIFYKFYLELKDKNILYENDEGTQTRILPSLRKEKTLIDRLHCTVLRHRLNLSTLMLQTFDSFLDQQLT